MGTQRWQLREMQQQRFLEKLLREAVKKVGNINYDNDLYRQFAIAILSELPKLSSFLPVKGLGEYELSSGAFYHEISRFVILMVERVREFSRTPEEALYLIWKLSEKLLECASHLFTRGYNSQTVLKQKKIYSGNATDDASEEEVQAALRD